MYKNTGDDATAAGEFTDGDITGGVARSKIQAEFLNTLLREGKNLVELAGLTMDQADYTQFFQAVGMIAAKDRNLIINGGMQVAQRGDVDFLEGPGWTPSSCDMIAVGGNNTAFHDTTQIEVDASVFGSSGFALRVNASSNNVVGTLRWAHRIEARDARQLMGKGGYLSVDVMHDAGYDVGYKFWVSRPGTDDDFGNLFTVYQDELPRMVPSFEATRLELQLPDLGASAENGLEIQLIATIGETPGFRHFDLTSLQLRPYTHARPFLPRLYSDELAACQYYFWRRKREDIIGDLFGSAYVFGSQVVGIMPLPSPMRSGGTVTIGGDIRFERLGSNVILGALGAYIAREATVKLVFDQPGETNGTAGSLRLENVGDEVVIDAGLF